MSFLRHWRSIVRWVLFHKPEAKWCSTSPLPLIGMMSRSHLFLSGLVSTRARLRIGGRFYLLPIGRIRKPGRHKVAHFSTGTMPHFQPELTLTSSRIIRLVGHIESLAHLLISIRSEPAEKGGVFRRLGTACKRPLRHCSPVIDGVALSFTTWVHRPQWASESPSESATTHPYGVYLCRDSEKEGSQLTENKRHGWPLLAL